MPASVNPNTPDDAQARILDAAGPIFADKGFEGATVREICQSAGVNIAAVNYYFRDKERLYIEAVKSACRFQNEQFPFPEWPANTPAVVKLREFIRTMAERMLNDDQAEWCRELFLREMGHPTIACVELVNDHMQPTRDIVMAILAELLPDVPVLKRMLIGLSIVAQCVFYKVAKPAVAQLVGEEANRQLTAQLVADHVTQFTFAALGLDAPGAEPSDVSKTQERKSSKPAKK